MVAVLIAIPFEMSAANRSSLHAVAARLAQPGITPSPETRGFGLARGANYFRASWKFNDRRQPDQHWPASLKSGHDQGHSPDDRTAQPLLIDELESKEPANASAI
jgi:hypothetical protein